MGRFSICLILVLALLAGIPVHSQTYRVSDPVPRLEGNEVLIRYDILNSTPEDEFSIRLSVQDDKGNVIPARSLSGDVGARVSGGNEKLIRWDLKADQIEIEAHIYFKIHARFIPPPEPVVVPPPAEEDPVQEDPAEDDPGHKESARQEEAKTEATVEEYPVAEKSYSRGGLVAQSLVLPGLGLSRMTGKPHWIRGVLAYGCLAGSVAMNRVAVSTYESIYGEQDYDRRKELFDLSLSRDQTSEILAYSAAAIWLVDFAWTLVGTSPGRGFSVHSSIDPASSVPLVVLTYRF